MTTATRLITLIMLLQNRPNQKAADMAAELGVSVRTLHRYFGMLDEMGIPVYAERGPYGGFSLVRGYKLPPLVFTPEEATAVALGTGLVKEMWGDLYRQAAKAALAKLENLLPQQQRDEVVWARRSLVTTGLYHPSLNAQAATLEKLRCALRESRQVELVYQSASASEPGTRSLDPYALALRWGWWYVVGYCHTRNAMRMFRIDRIQELTLLDQHFVLPVEFDTHAYLEQAQAERPGFAVTMRFAAEVASMAREYAIGWEKVEVQPDGALIVTMNAPDLNWAVSSALAYGPAVTVLAPDEVRRTVAEWARAVANLYPLPQILENN